MGHWHKWRNMDCENFYYFKRHSLECYYKMTVRCLFSDLYSENLLFIRAAIGKKAEKGNYNTITGPSSLPYM